MTRDEKQDLLDSTKLELLFDGGVDTWENYEDAATTATDVWNDQYCEWANDEVRQDPSLFLDALNMVGVESWYGYNTAIRAFNSYVIYVEETDEPINYWQWEDTFLEDSYNGY